MLVPLFSLASVVFAGLASAQTDPCLDACITTLASTELPYLCANPLSLSIPPSNPTQPECYCTSPLRQTLTFCLETTCPNRGRDLIPDLSRSCARMLAAGLTSSTTLPPYTYIPLDSTTSIPLYQQTDLETYTVRFPNGDSTTVTQPIRAPTTGPEDYHHNRKGEQIGSGMISIIVLLLLGGCLGSVGVVCFLRRRKRRRLAAALGVEPEQIIHGAGGKMEIIGPRPVPAVVIDEQGRIATASRFA